MSGTLFWLLRMTGLLEGLSKAPTKARSAGLEATIDVDFTIEISPRKYSMEAASLASYVLDINKDKVQVAEHLNKFACYFASGRTDELRARSS